MNKFNWFKEINISRFKSFEKLHKNTTPWFFFIFIFSRNDDSKIRRWLRVHISRFRTSTSLPVPLGGASHSGANRQRHYSANLRSISSEAELARMRSTLWSCDPCSLSGDLHSHGDQLLQCQVGDERHGYLHSDESVRLARDLCGWRLVFVLRSHRAAWTPIWEFDDVSGSSGAGILQRIVFIFGLELSQLCDGRAQGSVQVR